MLGQRQFRPSPGHALNAHSGNDWDQIPLLSTMKLTLMSECYCESRSLIDENNGGVGRSWIVFHHGIAPKVTSAAEIQLLFKECSFSSSSLYLSYVVFIIQLLFSKELVHQSRLYLNNVYFHHPASI